jgi:alkaline phosphatase D
MEISMQRRDLIKLAASAALAQSLPRSLQAASRADNLFALGVASGSPLHDGVVLWTRLIDPQGRQFEQKPLAVAWEVADDEGFRRIVQKGSAPALPELGHAVHVELRGLQPDRWYFYRFQCGNSRSVTGRTRTFPLPGSAASKLRLSYASCQRWEHGYYAAWRHMQDEQLDAVCFVGDYIYEYTRNKKDIRSHDVGKPLDLPSYRDRYAVYKSDADLQGMHAQCPWLLTWDDHEVINDYAGLQAPGLPADFPALRAAAYQAYYEHMPLRASVLTQGPAGMQAGAEMRLYDRVSFGDLADFHILDTRQYRTLQACSVDDKGGGNGVKRDACSALRDPQRSMLGFEQEAWLANGFKAARQRPPKWTLIVQETRFGPMRSYNKKGETSVGNDAWDGYPGTRARLVQSLIDNQSPNPVLLGGDVHSNWVGHVKADYDKPDSANVGVELTGTSISSNNNAPANIPRHVEENPHFIFGDGYRRGYGVVELSAHKMTANLRVVTDVTDPDAGIETLASFEQEAGRALLHRTR